MRGILTLTVICVLAAGLAPAVSAEPNCYWNPNFANLVYAATLGIVHLHDGSPICTVHVHLPTTSARAPDFGLLP